MPKKLDCILSEALIENGVLKSDQSKALLKEVDSSGVSLQELVVKQGIVNEKEALKALGNALKLPYVNLKDISIDKTVFEKVPVKIASYYKFIPIDIKDRVLFISVSSPLDVKKQDEIRTQLGYDIEIAFSTKEDILEGLKRYYGVAADTVHKIKSGVSPSYTVRQEKPQEKVEDIEKLVDDASVIKLVNQIILEAHRKRATDIHIEPYRDGLALRYRVDGVLYDANVPDEIKNFISAIISRIKIMSNLNIVERRLPQDGRAIVKVQNEVLDLRVSTMPTPFGESVVIRILPMQMLFSLQKLGLSKKDVQIFEKFINKPHGIIFVTGPTGSGKTTTLYACLSKINTKQRKIITLEDPIEYEMTGITQIQVMPEIGLTFARGLRSVLRHDPDVIMIGEVRDLETAEIAIRVALTGHLVLSTLHTNDAASGVTRLIDIGVEPYLLASSVEAFVAQRLIRVICPHCKSEDKSVPPELRKLIAAELKLRSMSDVKVYRSKGCTDCNNTGFYGRTAIYEILIVDETIKDLIIKRTSSSEIKSEAISRGMQTLRQDGWHKVITGMTTPEEVMKVTSVNQHDTIEYSQEDESAQDRGGAENRIFRRLENKVNVKFKLIQSEDELLKRGVRPEQFSATKNISAGGLLFVSTEPIVVGSFLDLSMELPDNKSPIQCLAKVVRVNELGYQNAYDIAVCYLDMTNQERTRLNRYIESD